MSNPGKVVCHLRYEGERPDQDRHFVIGDRSVTLGRSSDCDLVLNHESVSRAHARFSRDGDGWQVIDLDSKNGVRVNTFRVHQQKLRDGDRIDLGTARLHVDIGPATPRTARANVVFAQDPDRRMHTEILELSGLTSLFGPGGEVSSSALRPASTSISENIGFVADAGGARLAGQLLSVVGQAAEALVSCDTLDETLDRILGLVFDNLPAERGVICLYDQATDQTEPKVMRTRDGVPNEPIAISSNIVNHVLKRKQALLVKDTRADDRFGSAESVIMMEIHSAMCAPLYRDGRVPGFIYVDRQSTTEPFDTPHLHALSALAMLSAAAVERASLRDSVLREQEARSRLTRYSSPAVVDRILQAPGSAGHAMVAEERELTILFADIKGFTSMAESMRSADVISVLNRVLERLTEAVFQLEGTLDKFRGDGLMVFFGAPLEMRDHAQRAVEAALRMQESLDDLNASTGELPDMRIRIGINTGHVVVGDIGSPERKDYTVIGDAVNIASRLESAIAEPGQVVIGRATYERVHDRFECQPLAPVKVKGKREAVHPYLVLRRK